MADISKIKLGNTEYNIKDASARTNKQDKNDNTLETTSKTVVGAINELNEGKAGIDQVSNQNLLDNPWFTINKRDVTTFTVGAYGVDRWKLISGSASVNADNTITLNGTLRQIREFPLETNNFTCSVVCTSGTAEVSYDDDTQCFDIVSSGGTVKCAKLEYGNVSTLENDSAPDYATELYKCERFCTKVSHGHGYVHTNAAYITVQTHLRTGPVVSYVKATGSVRGVSSAFTPSSSITIFSLQQPDVGITLKLPINNTTTNRACTWFDGIVILDAEL